MEERKTYFVDVILPVPINNAFTYRVPFEMNDHMKTGVRVVVPFGRSKLQTGIIVRVHEEVPEGYQSKYVIFNSQGQVVSEGPLNSSQHRINVSSFSPGIYWVKVDNGAPQPLTVVR